MNHEQHSHTPHHQHSGNSKGMAVSATLHCLTGCAIGEIVGLTIGTALGLAIGSTMVLAILLAFVFGYSLSLTPLLRNGVPLSKALSLVLAADTLSILTMEITDNLVMAVLPGAMNAGLVNPMYWVSLPISLAIAFVVTVPVNAAMLRRGKGHALVHEHHHAAPDNRPLLYGLVAFILGGLLVSIFATIEHGM